MKPRSVALCAFLFVPAVAAAHSMLNETGVGTTQISPTNPRSGYWYDMLDGTVEVSKQVDLHLDVTLTHDAASPPGQGARFLAQEHSVVERTDHVRIDKCGCTDPIGHPDLRSNLSVRLPHGWGKQLGNFGRQQRGVDSLLQLAASDFACDRDRVRGYPAGPRRLCEGQDNWRVQADSGSRPSAGGANQSIATCGLGHRDACGRQ